ncbi:MAG: dipeptidase [Cytophagales bacterium]|nr:dipeptidase [Cytophagales bacterium]
MLNRFPLLLWLLAGCLPALAQAPADKALRIHRNALTVDSHADIPTVMAEKPGYDVGQRHDARATGTKIDLARMEEGGMDAMFFVVYVGQGPRTPEGYAQAKEEAAKLFDLIHAIPKKYPARAELATTPDDAYRIAKAGKRALFIGIENGWPVGKDLSLLKTYYDLGARYITLTHFLNNDICDSATDPAGPEHNGLSPFGEQVVAEMNRLGIMVDVSHTSDSTFYDVLRLSKAPVIASHSSVRALCDHPRNMNDDMLRALARTGGVIQMNMVSDYLRLNKPKVAAMQALLARYRNAASADDKRVLEKEMEALNAQFPQEEGTLEDVADHIDHVVKVAGIDHVGIGADLDGGGGVQGMFDVSEMGNITRELHKRGYSARDIEKIWSGNLFRVMRAVEKTAAAVR